MSHCIMHLPSDVMSQLRQPPQRHFVPLSQFESPHLGQSLHVSRAYLGYILGNFWPYLWHIYKKTIVQLAFFGRQIVPSDKMPHFLPSDKMSQLMHLCTGKLWKVVGTFCCQWKRLLGQFVASEKGQSWAYLGGYFSVRRHYNITICYKNIRERQVGQFVAIEKGNRYWAHLGNLTLIAIQKWQRNTNTKTKTITNINNSQNVAKM